MITCVNNKVHRHCFCAVWEPFNETINSDDNNLCKLKRSKNIQPHRQWKCPSMRQSWVRSTDKNIHKHCLYIVCWAINYTENNKRRRDRLNTINWRIPEMFTLNNRGWPKTNSSRRDTVNFVRELHYAINEWMDMCEYIKMRKQNRHRILHWPILNEMGMLLLLLLLLT